DGSVAVPGRFTASGLHARLTGSESRVAIELHSPSAQFELASAPEQPLEGVKVASVLEITRDDAGWRMSTEHLGIDHESGRMTVSGTLTGTDGSDAPVLDARVTIPHADLAKLHGLLTDGVQQVL